MTEPSTKKQQQPTDPVRMEVVRPQLETVGSLPDVLRSFRELTGVSLKYKSAKPKRKSRDPMKISEAPANKQSDDTPQRSPLFVSPVQLDSGTLLGHLGVFDTPVEYDEDSQDTEALRAERNSQLAAARSMTGSLADLLAELMQTRLALWEREAELAAGVPLVAHDDEEGHLALRLESAMKGGAEAVGCHAAALYLLDEATTQLKLRSCWGLPIDRLIAPPRRLEGQLADLEALLGHCVVLNEPDMMFHWKPPEDFPSAVCVPISTPTTVLGTLWLFCNESRDFNDRQTNVIEVIAGRIAADLEREMLRRAGADSVNLKNQISDVERLRRNQLPTVAPMHRSWEFSGWTSSAERVGGDFYDWYCQPGGRIALTVGDAMNRGLEAAMVATTLKATLRAHAGYLSDATQLLQQANLTLWSGSGGELFASVLFGLLDPESGEIDFSLAGRVGAIHLSDVGCEPLTDTAPLLGRQAEPEYQPMHCTLKEGEALVIVTDGVKNVRDRRGDPLEIAGLCEILNGRSDLSADQISAFIRKKIEKFSGGANLDDQTILVIKRITA